jgi:hypothetical protein
MSGTTVDPGDLDDFAKRVRELDHDWTDRDGAPQRVLRVTDGDWEYPQLGKFAEAAALRDQYNTARSNMAGNFNELHHLLNGLADASKKIADQYRSAEALNSASVKEIDRILGSEMATSPAKPGQPNPAQPA